MVGVDDIDALTFAGFMMNEHGMDPISFGVTLAAAMELYEMGVITEAQTDGIALTFGNAEALVVMSEKTGSTKVLAANSGSAPNAYAKNTATRNWRWSQKGRNSPGMTGAPCREWGWVTPPAIAAPATSKHDTFGVDMADAGTTGKAEACRSSQDFCRDGRFDRPVPVHHGRVGRR